MPTQSRTAAATLAVLALALTGCSNSAAQPWLTDDLHSDQGRYYTTCEDPADERHEKEVWLTDEQATTHAEGQPCPAGEVRTPPYRQAPGATVTRTPVPRPPRLAPAPRATITTQAPRSTAATTTAPAKPGKTP